MSTILTTNKLIASIRRRAFIPRSQETFTDSDFLEMASEEVNIGLMSYIIKTHEEYLVYYEDIPIVNDQNRYEIPERAHGNKLRDVSLVDGSGNLYELHRLSLEEISDFSGPYNYQFKNCFYLQNNEIVLASREVSNYASLRVYFYLRPNFLVLENRAGIITQISENIEIDNINPLTGTITNIATGTPSIITSANHGLTTGSKIQILGSNSTPSINGIYEPQVIDSNAFSIDINVTVSGNAGNWTKVIDTKVLSLDKVPSHFTNLLQYDLVQNTSPNKIVKYDLNCNTVDSNLKILSIPKCECDSFRVGQYITKAEESIVPNVPTELHPILAQRVAVACLEAMGDEQNKQSAERKLQQMEQNANSIIDNRVEGAPIKIKNRHSPLTQAAGVSGRRKNRW